MKQNKTELTLSDVIISLETVENRLEKKFEQAIKKTVQNSEKNIKDYVDVSIEHAIDNFGRIVKAGFDGVDKRFDEIDDRLDGIEVRLDRVETTVNRIEAQKLGERVTKLERAVF